MTLQTELNRQPHPILVEALRIAIMALRDYEDTIDGQYGPRPNKAMEALSGMNALLGLSPLSYRYGDDDE